MIMKTKMYLFKLQYWKEWWNEKDDNLYWKIYRFFRWKVRYWPYDLKYGVQNLIAYFPLIWQDRNWDYRFLYEMMNKKLERMEHNIRTYGHHVNSIKDANQIKECHEIIKRQMEDDYYGIYFEKEFVEKWGESDSFFTRVKDRDNLCQWNHDYEKAKTALDKEIAQKEWFELIKKAEVIKQKEKRKLFRIMSSRIEHWWD